MTRPHRRPALLGMGFVLLLAVQYLLGWTTQVQAAEGQLTRIGGNAAACPTDEAVRADFFKPLAERMKPTAITSAGYTRDRGIAAVASDLSGRGLYILSGEQILDRSSIVATNLAVGDDPASAKNVRTVGIAVDPNGGSLWLVQASADGVGSPADRVRRIDLTSSSHEVTTVAKTGPNPTAIAADARGNLYVTQRSGDITLIGPGGSRTTIGNIPGAQAVAVDVTGTEIYVAGTGGVYRLGGAGTQLIAGTSIAPVDGTPAVTTPTALALGHETDGRAIGARYLYIADRGRIVRVDLHALSPTITTVAGGGAAFVDSTSDARTAKLSPLISLAADFAGHIFIADSDQCAIFQLETPAPFAMNTAITQPPGVTNTTAPNGGSRAGDADKPVPDSAGASNGGGQTNGGGAGQQSSGPNPQTQIVPGSQTNVQPQPQTELRIIDQGNAVTTPNQVVQPSVNAVPTQAGAAQFTPTPAASPTPTPTPTPDAGTVTLVDPGTSHAAAIADPSAAAPAAPAPAPVPPPPAAQQPVSNVGLAHGDAPAPARGATRYAMVRNDEDQSVAGVAMAGAGALVALFLCVLFVAPEASSKPKPRPKGAY